MTNLFQHTNLLHHIMKTTMANNNKRVNATFAALLHICIYDMIPNTQSKQTVLTRILHIYEHKLQPNTIAYTSIYTYHDTKNTKY